MAKRNEVGLLTLANIVTGSRIILLLLLTSVIRFDLPWIRYGCPALIPILFYLDSLDGYLARRYHAETKLGSVLDIAGDRIVENVLWLLLAYLRVLPFWIPVLVLVRAFLTDGFRSVALASGECSTFSMMRSKLGWWLVASPISRTSYAMLKAVVFTAGLSIWSFRLGNCTALTVPFATLVTFTLLHCFARGTCAIVECSRSLAS